VHLLHVGDTRLPPAPQALEQLTEDHRVRLSSAESYLGRALGAGPTVEIDYRCWEAEPGEVYLLATDGVYEYLDAAAVRPAGRTRRRSGRAAAALVRWPGAWHRTT
jgi:serine/threonine protein phosphatase PrpC